jgi:Family of unknown function (DUF5684)
MADSLFLLAQADNGGGGAGALLFLLVELAIIVLIVAGFWMTFTKAGEPGWASIIPIYHLIVLFRIGGKPWWWVLLLLIPIVNLIISIIVAIDVAKNFGKGAGFAIGLAFLPFIFYPILGFGDARYQKVV